VPKISPIWEMGSVATSMFTVLSTLRLESTPMFLFRLSDFNPFRCIVFLSASCVFAMISSAVQAQQSNGLTFYHLADSTSKDANGNLITSIKAGPQTDGQTIAFESGSATTACDSAALLYAVPITGGPVSTLMGPSLQVESTEPAGTSTVLCSHLVVSGTTLFYPANYTPTGGTLRNGIFKMPLAGGVSTDAIATGDTTPFVNYQPPTGPKIQGTGTVSSVATTTFSADPSSNLIANYTATFSGSSALSFNTLATYGGSPNVLGGPGVGLSTCPGVSVPLQGGAISSGLTVGMESGYTENAPWYADIIGGTGVNYSGTTLGMQFIQISVLPYFGACGSIIFGPDLGSLAGGTTFILPGEPLPNTPTPVSTMTMGVLAVSNGVVYLSATQLLNATQGSYSGFFTIADNFTGPNGSSGQFPLPNGLWPARLNPIPTKIISNYDPVPGITLGLVPCPGGVSQIPAMSTFFTVGGNYLVFSEVQTLQNCSTMATSLAGGTYAYNLTTNTVQLVAPYGATLVPGDPAVTALNATLPGSLAPDGHLALVVGTATAGSSTTVPTLYSVYLPQLVTAVSLSAPATATYAGGVALTAKVSPNTGAASSATGSIKFVDGPTVLGTQAIDSTGSATINISSLGTGAHILQALYAGDALYEGASSATSTLTISKAVPIVTLTSSSTSAPVGQAIVLTAQAGGPTGYPTGQIVFSAGTTTLGTSTIGSTGSATLTLSTLPVGTTSVIATYAGDTNFTAATSAALAIIVGTPDYSVAASPTSATITTGQTATFVFTVTPVFGFNAPVTFSCGTLPSEASCTFAPAAVTPGTGPVTSTLTITTTAQKVSSNALPSGLFHTGGVAGVCFAVLLAWLPSRLRQKRRWTVFVLLGLLSAGVLSINGCSGGSSPSQITDPGTTKGTAAVTVSANAGSGSGATSHTASITVVIQ
jgi:Bacterial Ig-like domain (group 3)